MMTNPVGKSEEDISLVDGGRTTIEMYTVFLPPTDAFLNVERIKGDGRGNHEIWLNGFFAGLISSYGTKQAEMTSVFKITHILRRLHENPDWDKTTIDVAFKRVTQSGDLQIGCLTVYFC